jgi:hypothetical protein
MLFVQPIFKGAFGTYHNFSMSQTIKRPTKAKQNKTKELSMV